MTAPPACPRCGYSLRGLSGPSPCPECGEPPPGAPGPPPRLIPLLGVLTAATFALGVAFPPLWALTAATGVACVLLAARTLRRVSRREAPARERPPALRGLLLALFVLLLSATALLPSLLHALLTAAAT